MTKTPCNERGFTLVEVLVATMLMAVGVVGAASLLSQSSNTSSAAEHRVQASHLALSELEAIRALPYDTVGLDPEGKGFKSSYDDRESVVWVESATIKSVPLAPYSLNEIGGTEYAIFRQITWAAAGEGAYLNKRSYKVINITIQWTDSSGPHELQHESGIFRGGGS